MKHCLNDHYHLHYHHHLDHNRNRRRHLHHDLDLMIFHKNNHKANKPRIASIISFILLIIRHKILFLGSES